VLHYFVQFAIRFQTFELTLSVKYNTFVISDSQDMSALYRLVCFVIEVLRSRFTASYYLNESLGFIKGAKIFPHLNQERINSICSH